MQVFTVKISNIHCEDCHNLIKLILSDIFKLNDDVDEINKPNAEIQIRDDESVSILTRDGALNKRVQKLIIRRLERSGFLVQDYEVYDIDEEEQMNQHKEASSVGFGFKLFNQIQHYLKKSSERTEHLKNCSQCRENEYKDEDSELELKEVVTDALEFRAVFTVSGMTCSSCSNSIIDSLKAQLGSDLINPTKFSIDIVSNTATAIIPNKQVANKIIQLIKETGYNANLVELLPIVREEKYRLNAAIGGISCAACVSSISTAVANLDFLEEHAISVVSKSGVFILDSNEQDKIDTLKETIEDCGFDLSVVSVEKVNHAAVKKLSRTVKLKVDGMFCEHCPESITQILSNHGESVVIEDPISLRHPYVKFTYIPSPPALTIRSVLKELQDASPQFKVTMIKDISLDEHLRSISRKETIKIAYRLLLTTVFAIPTFIFGIVGMSLLSKSNHFRRWLDTPIIAGNVSRMTWVLFFLSTPVYFFAADIFHIKAIKEITSLWARNISWKRRLFRFGSMNLLMSLGTSVSYWSSLIILIMSTRIKASDHHSAFTTNYFDSVVFLSFFLLIGRLLESFSKSKTAEAISKLGNLKPTIASLVIKDGEHSYHDDAKIEIALLEVGDYIRILPGESPPVDCIIVEGTSTFDESALTGESVPVEHTVGEQVFAGTVNKGPYTLVAKLSTLDGTSLIDQIVNTVRDGQMKRAPIEKAADILTSVFVPIITFIAIIVWVVWISLGYGGKLPQDYLTNDVGGWAVWSLEFAIAVFVIACPCGIGLAAPTALFVGAGLAAKNGILARGGGTAFQEGSKINVVCFDKTGTLTMGGGLKITNYAIHKDDNLKKISLQAAKDLEVGSNHPLANAVKNFVDEVSVKKKVDLSNVKVPQAEEVQGKGLKGDFVLTNEESESIWKVLNPTKVLLGNEAFMKENKVSFTSHQSKILDDWKLQGKSIIIVSIQCANHFKTEQFYPILLMAARDEIRPEAKNVIEQLNLQKIETWMISGDNYMTAKTIAKEVGIDNVIAEVLPDEKAEKIKWIRSTHPGSKIAMVGDGINDAPALAIADVGIALASGSELALTSSDFVLLSPKFPLITLLTLLKLSRSVFRRVRFNFGWALVYNMIGVPIAAGVIYPYKHSRLSPVWASAAMALSSISVVLSSLALRFFKRPEVVTVNVRQLNVFEASEESL